MAHVFQEIVSTFLVHSQNNNFITLMNACFAQSVPWPSCPKTCISDTVICRCCSTPANIIYYTRSWEVESCSVHSIFTRKQHYVFYKVFLKVFCRRNEALISASALLGTCP